MMENFLLQMGKAICNKKARIQIEIYILIV